jgi:hypothetical protein
VVSVAAGFATAATLAAMRMRLRDGVSADQAITALRPLITEAGNIASAGTTPGGVPALRDAYLMWVEAVEAQLTFLTHDRALAGMLQTPRYWHIRQIQSGMDARPGPLVMAEVAAQRGALEDLVADLHARIQRLSASGGTMAVLDTNILLQYQEPWKLPWREILLAQSVRLIVPLRVVEELDEKKYSASKRLAVRARGLLPRLEALVGSDGSPGTVAQGVTIEVPVERGSRSRTTDADEEILAFCAELPQLMGAPVTLVTADTAMRLRAGAQGTAVVVPPDEYLRDRGDASTSARETEDPSLPLTSS